MENTLENKQKLFALYWNQKVGYYDKFSNWNVGNGVLGLVSIEFLELQPISSLTDEDLEKAIEILHYKNDEYFISHFGKTRLEYAKEKIIHGFTKDTYVGRITYLIECIDYLRSKGYALPWMGISVEKQIEYGWIKLNTNN